MSCLFCRIANGDIPARFVHQDERVVAFYDTHPQAPTHVLIIPRTHISSIDLVGSTDGPLLVSMIASAQEVARSVGAEQSGYRLIFNHGADAGQSVDHVHMHLLAGREFGWPPG